MLDVKRDVDVVLSTGEVLEHQLSSYLQPNILYQPGQHVLHKDGWFGRIDEVQRRLCATIYPSPAFQHDELTCKNGSGAHQSCLWMRQVYVKLTVAFDSGALVELTDLESTERPLLWPMKSPGFLTPTVSEASEFYPGQSCSTPLDTSWLYLSQVLLT